MKDYFFIPASKLSKVSEFRNLTNIIVDFEDSILVENIPSYLKTLERVPNYHEFWYRIPIRKSFEEPLDLALIAEFYKKGVKNFVIPKIKTGVELEIFINTFKDCHFIVIVEHPQLILNLSEILLELPNKQLIGLGVGLHDYLAVLGSNSMTINTDFIRLQVLHIARAFGLQCIDFASMNISEENQFLKTIENSLNQGFDSKFLIHPNQLNWLHNYLQNEDSKLKEWAKKILSHFPGITDYNVEPTIIDGQIIEKPHIIKALKILKNESESFR